MPSITKTEHYGVYSMNKRKLTEEEKLTKEELLLLAKELEIETPEQTKEKERIRRFEKLNMKRMGVPEWRLLLVLAYNGPLSKYDISKMFKFHYATVHRAAKSLERIGWVEVVETKTSEKNVVTKIYNLTGEGLLWIMSRIPKTVHHTLVVFSEDDSLGLRKTLSERDISKVQNLETQDDVYLHLLLDFDADKIAENNTNLFPLVFENWDLYKKIGVARIIAGEFPETAFSTLVMHYYNYASDTLDRLFPYKLYCAFLELYTKGYVGIHPDYKDEHVRKVAKVFKSNPQLQELFEQISKPIAERLTESITFINRVEKKIDQKST